MTASALPSDAPKLMTTGRRKDRGAYPAYLFALAGDCQRRRKMRWAKSLILKAVELDPLNPEFNSRASAIMEASGDLDRAIAHMAAAAVSMPQHPHIVAGLARLLHRKGLNVAALHHIEIAVRLLPDNAYFPKLLSEIKKAAGR